MEERESEPVLVQTGHRGLQQSLSSMCKTVQESYSLQLSLSAYMKKSEDEREMVVMVVVKGKELFGRGSRTSSAPALGGRAHLSLPRHKALN